MNSLLTLVFLSLFTVCTLHASDTSIVFRQLDHGQALEAARKEKKPVLLYFHFDGCGACRQMEKTSFRDPAVIELYNSSFVTHEVNTRKGEGIETNKIYGIQMHPTFLFLDSAGRELHRIVGVFSPEEFMQQADNVLSSGKTLQRYKAQYNAGKRDADFLLEYCYILRDAFLLDSSAVQEYLNTLQPGDFSQEKTARFIYEFCIYRFDIQTPFGSPAFGDLLENRARYSAIFEAEQVDTRIVWILYHTIGQAIAANDRETFETACAALEPFDTRARYAFKELDGRTTGIITGKHLVLSSRVSFHDKNGSPEQYRQLRDQYLALIWDDAYELNSFAWSAYEQTEDREKLDLALRCSERSVSLAQDIYYYRDTYASLLFKLGDHDKALEAAQEAVELARKNGNDPSETIGLIERIELARKK